jgi:hypothetical protein
MIWNKHATSGGIASLFLCIAGGIIYKQAPMKGALNTSIVVTADDEAFKTDVSDEEHQSSDEGIDLIEKQSDGSAKRRT